MAMTYSSLQNDIKVWAENTGTDFTAQLETFIGNAFHPCRLKIVIKCFRIILHTVLK